MSPAEAPDVVEGLQVEEDSLRVLSGEVTNPKFIGLAHNVSEESAMGRWAISSEFVENLGQRCIWHRNLEEMIKQWYLAVVMLARSFVIIKMKQVL